MYYKCYLCGGVRKVILPGDVAVAWVVAFRCQECQSRNAVVLGPDVFGKDVLVGLPFSDQS